MWRIFCNFALANQRRAPAFRADMHYLLRTRLCTRKSETCDQPLGADTHYLFRANLKVCHPKIRENVTNIVSIVALRSVEYSGE